MKLLAFCASLALCLSVYAQQASAPASAASAVDPITYSTECGAPGVGRLVGRAEPVARSASEAAGSYVAADGYWHAPCLLVATPNTACGAPGVGYLPGTGMLRMERPGKRVDAAGDWVDCDRPCTPEKPMASRTWAVDGHVCTTHSPTITSPTDPRRDRTIRHGQSEAWAQLTGRMRGVLIERCDDGRRETVLARCAPATHCDTRIEATRAGKTYVYDGIRQPVPLGASVALRAADGSTWPATCVDGSWDAPSVLPRPPAPAASRPGPVAGCRPGVWSSAGRYYRYDGPIQPAGAVIQAQGLMGAAPAQFVCDGNRWAKPIEPIVQRPPTGETAADEWLRIFKQLEQGRTQ